MSRFRAFDQLSVSVLTWANAIAEMSLTVRRVVMV
jgi:hypothetical protein